MARWTGAGRVLWLSLMGCTGALDPSEVDADGDGVTADADCDDGDPRVRPGAWDFDADGLDADCDGEDGRGLLSFDQLPLRIRPTPGFAVSSAFVLCDVTGDGVDDLLGTTRGVLLPDLPSVFLVEGPLSRPTSPREISMGVDGDHTLQIRCGDLDGNGRADLIVATGDSLLIHTAVSSGTIDDVVALPVAPTSFTTLDTDGDGARDLVLSGEHTPAPIWVIPGAEAVAGRAPADALPGYPLPGAEEVVGLQSLGDLDGDGADTLQVNNGVEQWLIDDLATGIPGATHHWGGRFGLVIADLDGDGTRDDAVWASSSFVGVGIDALADDEIVIEGEVRGPDLEDPQVLPVGDVNDDGAEDLALVGRTDDLLVLRILSGAALAHPESESVGPVSLLKVNATISEWGANNLRAGAGDLDGDGQDEVLVTLLDRFDSLASPPFFGWLSSAW